ncbi:hypothetical protein H2201_003313 [Coniosporium apollinis]|uniref:Uncharacterized protein n=1 Tax=Coniosporium apollinis TaxID=61459 RepID=A0ABQ9NW87_9PEZI|nr:hypothetical protein H2201_003313 [Coniosporium apollinis]
MKLTKPEDKLIALAGIVAVFQRFLGEYLAGIWRNWLPMDLLWCTRWKAWSRAEKFRAPSWSWASIDGPIMRRYCRFDEGMHEALAAVVDVSVAYKDSHASSLVTGAELHIMGKLALAGPRAGCESSYYGDDFRPFEFRDVSQCPPDERKVDVKFDDSRDEEDRSTGVCLPIKRNAPSNGIHGLALRKVEGQIFRRVGLFVRWRFTTFKFERLPQTTVTII